MGRTMLTKAWLPQRRLRPRISYRPNPEVDGLPDSQPGELELLIQAHASSYPENDPRRVWIAKALRRWAGSEANEPSR